MSRKFLVVVSALVAASFFGTLGLLRGVVPPSSFILRSGEELDSLCAVLHDEPAWAALQSLSARMSLWRTATTTESAAPEDGCLPLGTGESPPEKVRHRFEFASPAGVSSRVYRMDFLTCKKEGGSRAVELARFGFGSDFYLEGGPLLAGTAALKVLRFVLGDKAVAADLVSTLQERDVSVCNVVEEGPGAEPGTRVYRFSVTAPLAEEPEQVLEYRIEYDEAGERGEISRLR
jgi:hypothetical protein